VVAGGLHSQAMVSTLRGVVGNGSGYGLSAKGMMKSNTTMHFTLQKSCIHVAFQTIFSTIVRSRLLSKQSCVDVGVVALSTPKR
jgi:hypothetical protein